MRAYVAVCGGAFIAKSRRICATTARYGARAIPSHNERSEL
jgi:hypothetical protein